MGQRELLPFPIADAITTGVGLPQVDGKSVSYAKLLLSVKVVKAGKCSTFNGELGKSLTPTVLVSIA